MGIPDSSIPNLIAKLRSWVSWGGGDISGVSKEYWMPDNSCRMCYECDIRFSVLNRRHHCRSCGRVFCSKCMQDPNGISSHGEDREQLKFCKFCFQAIGRSSMAEFDEKLDLLMSPGQSFDFAQEKYNNKRLQTAKLASFLESHRGSSSGGPTSCATSSIDPLSPISFRCTASRSDEEDVDDARKRVFSPSNEYSQDVSDADASSINAGNEFDNCKSVASSPLDSPSLMTGSPNRTDFSLHPKRVRSPSLQSDPLLNQESIDLSRRQENDPEDMEPTDDSTDLSIFHNQSQGAEQPLDFESNGLIWFPPPPEDEDDDAENNFFEYDDEDDEIGDSSATFSSSSFSSEAFSFKEKPNDGQKEPLRAVVHGHFRALVLQLLKGEGICIGNEIGGGQWLEIVSFLASQAANFMRPDTSRGGSMDPGNYVKVKCMASGDPCESTLIKGVVCTKNVKHKRMTSQYRNPILLLLGGALEYQRVPNQLASMDTLLQQEIDHLKMAVAKIEAHRPNVLLVEKSVSSYAQEYLLAKEISLVLNVKRPLLERIARCTGAQIIPSIDNLASARLGHCEVFRLEKVTEEISAVNQPNKRSTKTLMFFEGCPRRLGCTVLLRGKSLEELKKVKHVVQYAVFAAYHLSLETSFLADEGASLPKVPLKPSIAIPERLKTSDCSISMISQASVSPPGEIMVDEPLGVCSGSKLGTLNLLETSNISSQEGKIIESGSELEEWEASNKHFALSTVDLVSDGNVNFKSQWGKLQYGRLLSFGENLTKPPPIETPVQEEVTLSNHGPAVEACDVQDNQASAAEYFTTADNNQSILVSLSSRCVLKGTVCERSQLFRIKFYGSFDKPLGRFLRDDLFDQRSFCRSCNEPAEAHMRCYTHQQGSLTINVRRLPSLKLPGERDGKIWMWHRCLKCALKDGVPPASRRVVMSDAAWGLSFGKFLELSFSNHATANRVASCGHSLQRDCLRYYGFGSMVAFFRYSPIDILSVHLPPLILEFNGQCHQEWIQTEAVEVSKNMEFMYAEVFDVLQGIEQKLVMSGFETSKASTLSHINELKDMLKKERNEYEGLLQFAAQDYSDFVPVASDILELNRVRRCLLIESYLWDRRLSLLDSFLKSKSPLSMGEAIASSKLKMSQNESLSSDGSPGCGLEENDIKSLPIIENSNEQVLSREKDECNLELSEPVLNEHFQVKIPIQEVETIGCEAFVENKSLDSLPSPASNLSDKIDLAWTGSGQPNEAEAASMSPTKCLENLHHRRVMAPVRVHSFDSGLRFHDKVHKGLSPASLHLLSSVRSFHASGDFGSLVHDPILNRGRAYTQTSPLANQKLNFIFGYTPFFVSLTSCMVSDGARLLLPLSGSSNVVIAVYDNEPTSIVAYALSSKEYMDYMTDRFEGHEIWNDNDFSREDDLGHVLGPYRGISTLSAWQSFSSVDSDDLQFRSYGSYGSDGASLMRGAHVLPDSKRTPHVRISFGDESSLPSGKVKFSVTIYFAKQFDALRKKCCPSEVDFLRSISRCKRWSAQGGKSNVYFAKTLDERFIIKQVTKTELESFEEFAPQYFKYLMDSLSSGCPTCLAKVLGIYQVTVKHLKGGKEVKMDLMVMENLFFQRSISRVYDLKGSARSRYNSDTTGGNNVLLDLNLLEALRTNPMFLRSKAKRTLERAVWNDTSFLASIDVMDYSLLVGVDEERKELVLGIIDFMRQYTWDKHLETWVKASGILGGRKNASPTVVSPKQYKKRFRKAMSTYFLTVPDQMVIVNSEAVACDADAPGSGIRDSKGTG
ncbi:putative 1-phosphatidylinositol-3-phosphate 5-kinase FAB1C [Aristolochia californica]|uniref:putative 1-phosphatidylinositol-3-phosphate 5-kinase FAB1C n=1 Tax=Aristolochia californica TaxID=171875 RepID=UPI0035DE485A